MAVYERGAKQVDLNSASIMMRLVLIGMILLVVLGCKSPGKTKEGHATIRDGDLVELTAVEKTAEGSILWRSADYDRTALIVCAPSIFKDDLFAALRKLRQGDSAIVMINLDSMVEKMGHKRPPQYEGKFVVYELVIHKVISGKGPIDSFMQQRMAQLKKEEAGKLADYIRSQQLETTVLPSGLQYSLASRGPGITANAGDTVAIRYTTYLMSGKVIDSALYQPRTFIAGLHTTIAGLEEAIQLLPEHSKATIVIPSSLAFGEAGYEGIQPYTPLIYELEVVHIGRFAGKRPNEVGAPLPDFAVINIANNILVQKEDVQKGKVAFVLFSTDCDHCHALIASIEKHFSMLKNIHWYFVSPDGADAIRRCMHEFGPGLSNAAQVTICRDEERRMAGIFQAAVFPSVYVYNDKHVLRKCFSGMVEAGGIVMVLNSQLKLTGIGLH